MNVNFKYQMLLNLLGCLTFRFEKANVEYIFGTFSSYHKKFLHLIMVYELYIHILKRTEKSESIFNNCHVDIKYLSSFFSFKHLGGFKLVKLPIPIAGICTAPNKKFA